MSISRATHSGQLAIANVMLPCFVLDEGTRVLSQEGLLRAFGRSCQEKAEIRDARHPPVFLAPKNLKPFIPGELLESSTPVQFRTPTGSMACGYRAEVLPGVCDVYLSARDAAQLLPAQEPMAKQADVLVRRLAHVNIIARIDEASNYQETHHSAALQDLLDRYLRPFAARWTKRFPEEFYQEIYRLRGWKWQGMSVNRPSITGHYTNEIVYARIADGLLDQLRLNNPKNVESEREHRHHQWLSDDFGVQELREHIVGVLAIMRTVVDPDPKRAWQKFYVSLQRAYPRKNTNYHFDFDEED